MKSLTISFSLAFLLSFASVDAQQIVQEQTSLVIKVSADWCTNCGSWGWDFYEELIADNEDKAIFLTAHHSGGLRTDAGKEMALNYNISYQPFFIVNNENIDATRNNTTPKRLEVKSMVDNVAQQDPVAALGMDVFFDDALSGDVSVRFNEAVNGEYYVGIYGLEDHVMWSQAARGNPADHRYVLRDHNGEDDQDVFGEVIASGAIAAGASYQTSFGPLDGTDGLGLDLENQSLSDVGVVAILWKKVNGDFEFVNALHISGDEFLTSTTDREELDRPALHVTVDGARLTFRVVGIANVEEPVLQIHDMNGRLLREQKYSSMDEDVDQTIDLGDVSDQIVQFTLIYPQGRLTRKLYIR